VAVIVGALAGVTAGAVAQTEPERAIDPAAVSSINADKVDGKHAVKYTAKRTQRRNKLVATNWRGELPPNIVRPQWRLIKGVPAGFADGVDNAGVSGIKVTRVVSDGASIDPGTEGFADANCPIGSVIVGGGSVGSYWDVHLTTSFPVSPTTWRSHAHNTSGTVKFITAHAMCMSVEPSGAITTASKGKLSPAGAKGKGR
jgi:hypothetical protein